MLALCCQIAFWSRGALSWRLFAVWKHIVTHFYCLQHGLLSFCDAANYWPEHHHLGLSSGSKTLIWKFLVQIFLVAIKAKVLSVNTFSALAWMHIERSSRFALVQLLHDMNQLKGKGENKGTEIWTSLTVFPLPPTVSSSGGSGSFEKFLEGSVGLDHINTLHCAGRDCWPCSLQPWCVNPEDIAASHPLPLSLSPGTSHSQEEAVKQKAAAAPNAKKRKKKERKIASSVSLNSNLIHL